MMHSGTKSPVQRQKRHKRESADRLCVEASCHTKLSAYNHNDTCYSHSPRKYPRVRGRFTE